MCSRMSAPGEMDENKGTSDDEQNWIGHDPGIISFLLYLLFHLLLHNILFNYRVIKISHQYFTVDTSYCLFTL